MWDLRMLFATCIDLKLLRRFPVNRFAATALAALLLAPVATPVLAQEAPAAAVAPVTVKSGMTLRDANGRRVGTIDSVRTADGVITVISDMKLLRVPMASLSKGEKGLMTSLKVSELR